MVLLYVTIDIDVDRLSRMNLNLAALWHPSHLSLVLAWVVALPVPLASPRALSLHHCRVQATVLPIESSLLRAPALNLTAVVQRCRFAL